MLVMLIQSVGSQPPPPHNHYLATTLSHPSLHAWTSPRMHPYHVTLMSALTVDEWEMTPWDLSSSSAPTTTTIFFNPCSMCLIWGCSPVVNTLTDYVDWKNIGCRVQCSLKKKWFHMWAQGCLLSQRLHPPLSTSSFLSHTCARPILLHPIHFPLSTHFRVLPPFLSPLWRMNGLVSGAILCPSRRSGVCAASHWSSKWAGNGAGGPGC